MGIKFECLSSYHYQWIVILSTSGTITSGFLCLSILLTDFMAFYFTYILELN